MKDILTAFFKKEWTLEEKVLLLVDVLLTGVLLGWITSPFKGGLFSNNTIASTLCGDGCAIEPAEDDEE